MKWRFEGTCLFDPEGKKVLMQPLTAKDTKDKVKKPKGPPARGPAAEGRADY